MRSEHTAPYIVTAYRNGPWPHTSYQRDVVSRRAVAGLEAARERVADELRSLTADQPSRARHPLFDRAYGIGECGDALQLPDGTVIEVERVTYWHLAERGGWEPPADDCDYSSAHRHGAVVIDAYNGRQGS